MDTLPVLAGGWHMVRDRQGSLPFSIMDLAVEMFAGNTGFSGPQIHRFFSQYSDDIPDYAWGGGSPSRKDLFRTFLAKFPVEQQKQILIDACRYAGPMKYSPPPQEDVEKLLALLQDVHTPAFREVRAVAERLDWQWVVREWEWAREQVDRDPAGAITAARSMLESVCKHVVRALDPGSADTNDLPKLYRTAQSLLEESLTPGVGDGLDQILSGCRSIANGIATLRNDLSDAHGRGPGDPAPARRHALLAVNAAGTLALYLMQAFGEKRAGPNG